MENNFVGGDVFFLLMGAILVFAMHAGFAFLEVGTVREKNQVNAMVKIISDFAMSTIAYFFIGYSVAYGVDFLAGASVISGGGETETFGPQGLTLIKFFFLLTFAAAIPAIISGGIAERARFVPQLLASGAIVAVVYPFFEGMIWNGNFGFQAWLEESFGAGFTTLQVPSWCTASVVGWPWPRSLCWAPAPDAMAIAERRSRLLQSPGWRWAVGFCALAGSASTWLARNRWKAFPVWSRLIP